MALIALRFLLCLAGTWTASGSCAKAGGSSCTVDEVDNMISDSEDFEVEAVNMQLLQHGLTVMKTQAKTNTTEKLSDRKSKAGQEPVIPKIPTTTLDPTGLTLNAVGDLSAFVSGFVFNCVSAGALVVVFNIGRNRYQVMYENNIITGQMPAGKMTPGIMGWLPATLSVSIDGVAEHMGLDQAMLLEFCNLGIRIMAMIGVPLFFICGPINWSLGGHAAGEDRLSYLSFGNVENGSQLYWLYAFVVWGVVFSVQRSIFNSQKAFMIRRFKWLREMAPLRANTILIEGVPESYCSDQKVHEYFEEVMPGDGNVVAAYLAKDTSLLLPKVKALESARKSLHEAKAQWEAAECAEDARPMTRATSMPLEPKVDSITHFTNQIEQLEPQVAAEREELEKLSASQVGGVNLSKGFVTFKGRVEAEIALRLTGMSENLSEWILSTPPAPEDIQWNDLTQDPTAEKLRMFFGYLCVAGLYFLYLPAVIFITNLASVIDLGPYIQPLWESLAPTAGLLFMVSFLPTFLILVFQLFFTLRAGQWAQLVLQNWYWWFQVVFVILVTAVGQDTVAFTKALFTDPIAVFHVLADTMPYATHFFMNYQVVQYFSDALCLTRYVNLGKFWTFSKLWSEEEARAMAEPEDQDYYGMGGRSARFSVALAIGIIYGTLSPPITMLTLILFTVKRVIYGYLIPFSETKKTDLGGVFWVRQLEHLFVAEIIYVLLMTGVLLHRADSSIPAWIAGTSIFYVLWAMHRFQTQFHWVNLPLHQVLELEKDLHSKKRPILGAYMQPELQRGDSTSATVISVATHAPDQVVK